jgi:hypothetical protein
LSDAKPIVVLDPVDGFRKGSTHPTRYCPCSLAQFHRRIPRPFARETICMMTQIAATATQIAITAADAVPTKVMAHDAQSPF